MAVNLGSIYSYLELRLDRFNAALQQAKTKINEAESAISRASRRIGDSMRAAEKGSKMLAGAFAGLAAAAGGLAIKSLGLSGELEQVEVAFTTMLGSGEKAKQLLVDLNEFAASTPFQFPDLAKAAKTLSAFGVETENLIPSLRRIGDISAGIGAPVGEIAEIYGKARVQGRLFMEDINQLTGRGIPIIQELAKQFGVAESEVRSLVEQGMVGFPHLERAFISLTSEGGRFAGLMENQSKTLLGLWSTIKDNITLTLAPIGNLIVDTFDLKGVAERAIAFLGRIRQEVEGFRELVQEVGLRGALEQVVPPELEAKIVVVAGAIAGALVPALIALAKAAWAAVAPLLPWIAAGAAIAGLAYLIYKNWDKITTWFRETWTRFVEWLTGLWEYVKTTALLVWDFITAPTRRAIDWLVSAWDSFSTWWESWWDRLIAWVGGWIERLLGPFRSGIEWLTAAWQSFSDWWHGWWDRLAGWVRTKVDAVLNPIRSIIAWVQDALDWLGRLFGAQDKAAGNMPAAPSSPSTRTSAGNIPHLATGGIVTRPMLALIGEVPEAVIPLHRLGREVPAAAAAGPVTIVVQLEGRTIARAVLPHMHREITLKAGV